MNPEPRDRLGEVSGWRALGLIGLLALAPGCKGLTYACTDDGECGADGMCEADGWCSFPDERCDSGRRYGTYSGGGLGGVCVDLLPGTSSGDPTTTADASTTDASSSTSVDTGSSTGDPLVETSSTSLGSTSSDPSTSSGTASGSSSTGDAPQPCVGWVDEFDDGVIGPEWTVYGGMGPGGHVMEEANGVLHWAFAEGIVEQRGIQTALDGPIEGLRVQTAALPETIEAQTVLLIRDPDNPPDLFVVWGNSLVDFRIGSDSITTGADWGWVEVRFEDGLARVSRSDDGVSFETLVEVDVSTDPGALELFLYGQTWTEAPVTTEGAFERIQLCEP